MGQGSQGDRSDTLTGGGGFTDPGFGDTTARQEKPSHLMDVPNVPDPSFGDTTAKQSKPPDVYALEADTIKGGALPQIPSRDEAVTIKDSHKKTMQSAVAVDPILSPETKVPSTLDDDEPAPEQPKAPRVGPPTLASPGIPQAEWDSAAYPHIERPAPPPNMPPPNVAPLGPPMGYGPPQAAGSGSYAQAQPRPPLPPTYRIKREGSGGQVAIILIAVGFCFAIFAAGILMFVSKRMSPTASTRSTPPAEIAPGSPTSSPLPITTATSTTPPLQIENAPPPVTAAPPPTTPPRATPSASPKPGKAPKAPKGQLQDNR